MRILVTGAAGFIGSRVVSLLTSDGHEVVGLDSLNDAYDPRIKDWRLARLQERPGLEFHRVDLSDVDQLSDIVASSRAEAVVNLAARAGVRESLKNPWVYYETNVIGTLNLLDLCRRHGVPKFVLASTSSVYGDSTDQPFREDMSTDRPLSPYAASKKAAEALTYAYHHSEGIDVTVLRYFTVYGPAGRPDMATFRFIRWIAEGDRVSVFGDGTQRRDFTYVDDIARGTVSALKPLGYETINLGNSQPASLLEVIALIEQALGKRANISFGPPAPADVPATWADNTKAAGLLGWTPAVALTDGLERTVRWYIENRELARSVRL